MTFDALSHALVKPDETLLLDDPDEMNTGLSRFIQKIIDEHLNFPEFYTRIRKLMFLYFRGEWEATIEGKHHLSKEDFLKLARSRPVQTLGGETVKSEAERTIANTLFEHGVDYRYEDVCTVRGESWRPDFQIKLPRGRWLVLEYFGLVGEPEYDRQVRWKKSRFAELDKKKFEYAELSPRDHPRLRDAVLNLIERFGGSCSPLSEDEIWEKIEDRAITTFDKIVRGFVTKGRQLGLDEEALWKKIDDHSSLMPGEKEFLELGAAVYVAYLKQLASENREDFPGLCWRASAGLETGASEFVRQAGRENGDLGVGPKQVVDALP